RVWDGKHVGIGRSHVEPARKSGKARPVLGHIADRDGGSEFRPQRAEKIDIGNEEIFDSAFFRCLHQVCCHDAIPFTKNYASLPGIQPGPASGTRAIAAASTVRATRSSGSRLCTWLLPQARAMVWVSSVSTAR